MEVKSIKTVVLNVLLLVSLPMLGRQQQAPVSEEKSATEAFPTTTPDLTPGIDGKLSPEQMRQLFRVVADKDIENEKLQRDYTYTAREVENKLDGNGQIKTTEVKTYEILEIYGAPVQRLVQKNDQPLGRQRRGQRRRKDPE